MVDPRRSKRSSSLSRRNALKRIGTTGVLLSALSGIGAADSPSTHTIHPSTEGHDALNQVEVTLTEDNTVRVDMSGTIDPENHGTEGYRVKLTDAQTADGRLTPQQADTTVVELPQSELPSQEDDQQRTISGSESDSTTVSTENNAGTLDHGGGDNQQDSQGGAWARTEDPFDITVAKTNHWIKWTSSNGRVDSARLSWQGKSWKVSSPPTPPSPGKNASIWKVKNIGPGSSGWPDRDVKSTVHGDYINWTWSYDKNKTTSHHRVTVRGNPNGSLDWHTTHWHKGEDSALLRVDAGIYGKFKNPS